MSVFKPSEVQAAQHRVVLESYCELHQLSIEPEWMSVLMLTDTYSRKLAATSTLAYNKRQVKGQLRDQIELTQVGHTWHHLLKLPIYDRSSPFSYYEPNPRIRLLVDSLRDYQRACQHVTNHGYIIELVERKINQFRIDYHKKNFIIEQNKWDEAHSARIANCKKLIRDSVKKSNCIQVLALEVNEFEYNTKADPSGLNTGYVQERPRSKVLAHFFEQLQQDFKSSLLGYCCDTGYARDKGLYHRVILVMQYDAECEKPVDVVQLRQCWHQCMSTLKPDTTQIYPLESFGVLQAGDAIKLKELSPYLEKFLLRQYYCQYNHPAFRNGFIFYRNPMLDEKPSRGKRRKPDSTKPDSVKPDSEL